jgi:hypothetical protein
MRKLNIDILNKWLSAGASISVIVGVIVAICSVIVAINTLKQTQGAASATLVGLYSFARVLENRR